MSTLSGLATKGEKGKPKFQSLDINNLYRPSWGESLETHQHKNASSRRHGMQSLGKVPSARRAPANLPSLKSEYSGNDPAVSLVPSGGTGWGSKPGETGPAPTSTTVATSTTATVTSAPSTTVTATVTSPPVTSTPTPTTTTSQGHVGDKSWSSITSSGTENTHSYLAHQSPYFQQEFPSLSGDASQGKGDSQHLPGPSLRPQTEGSWMQGGSRPQGQTGAAAGSQQGTVPVPGPHLSQGLDVGGGRSNLGPSGVAAGPAGPMPPHHYRLLPQFMLRHNHPSGGFPPNYQHGPPRPRMPYPPDTRFMPPNRGSSNVEPDEISRPIIKEEDLKVMDEIARDTGWAAHDEIDYNQTLSFSDEEAAHDEEKAKKSSQSDKKEDNRNSGKEIEKDEKLKRENSRDSMNDNREPPRAWQQPRTGDFRQGIPPAMMGFPPPPNRAAAPPHSGGRQGEDDEVWRERRRLQNEEIAIAVERAKQRKEEEEKRYEETRQAAARKLQMLEEKMRSKSGVEKDENRISPNLTVQHGSNSLLPDWEKDKDQSRSRTSSEDKDEKPPKEHAENFRNVQMDNRGNFGRDRERERDRDLRPDRESGTQPFSRQFQNNLPPRFQKHAAERPPPYYRQNSSGSPQPPPYDTRWSAGPLPSHFGVSGPVGNAKSHRNRNDSDISDRERDDNKENNRDRDRSGNEVAFDRERFNRPPSRDSRERSYENNWKNSGHNEESNRRISDSNQSHEYDNRQYEKCQESDEYNNEKEKDIRFYDNGREVDKKTNENFKSTHLIQEDPFDERENVYDNKAREEGQNERRDLPKREEHRERPQRPDSRDSRASRNSRDSAREEKLIEETTGNETSLSWADSSYDVDQKEDKRRKEIRDDLDTRRDAHASSYHQRHIPGPITKEKLEADLKSDPARSINLVPLIRNENKKPELKKSDNQWEGGNGGDAWQRVPQSLAPPPPSSESWAVMTSSGHPANTDLSSDVGQGEPSESQQLKVDGEDGKAIAKTSAEREEIDVNRDGRSDGRQMGRGNRGMRHDTRGPRGWGGSSYYRGAAWRGADRGRRSQHRRPHMGRSDWPNSESEASADEVSASTESGKEDKRQDQDRKHYPRSPKQGSKKTDKDDRLRDSNRKIENEKDGYGMMNDNRRYDKKGMYDSHMERGFPPRGEPSRRGRGGAPFRSKGSSTNVGRRMDGYGPPTSKKPFTSDPAMHIEEDKKSDGSSLNQALSKEEAMSKLSHDEKMKMNQQQLAAGIIGSSRLGNFKSQSSNMPPRLRKKSEGDRRDRKPREVRRGPRGSVKSGSGSGGEVGDEAWETTSEASDHEDQDDNRDKPYGHSSHSRGRRHSQPNRSGGREKHSGGSYDRESRKSMVNGSMRGPGNKPAAPRDQQDKPSDDKKLPRPDVKDKRNNLDRIDLCNTASVVVVDDQPEVTVEEDQTVFAPDNNGFQEVRSKKNVKEANRQQKEEPQKGSRERTKPNKPQSPCPPGAPLAKGQYNERPRTGKLPPRFAKLRETSRLQKMAQQQHTHDINELNKINQGNVPIFPVKDLTSPAPPPPVNAWDKPITASLRTVTPPSAPAVPLPNPALQDTCNIEVNEHAQSTTSSQRSSPSGDKTVGKFPREPAEKTVLDGTSPPVQTIIFENTNFKSAPVDVAMKSKYTNQINKNQRTDKSREIRAEEENVGLGFKSPGPDMNLQDTKADPIQMSMSFTKNEDSADMKLDFRFDSDLTQLTDDKATKSITAIQMTRSIQMASQSSAAELQFKLASVKKVWENPPAVLEHGGEEHPGSTVSTTASFTPTFGNSVEDPGTYGKPVDSKVVDDGSEGVYNAGPQLQNNPNSYNGTAVQNMIKPDPSTNVCKVKPQPQATMHPHSGPLSPPTGAFNSSPAQPSQHINYQPQAQYGGISAIPSPPTVFTPQAELYPAFQMNNPQVMSSQGRSQFSQFAPYLSQGLGQTSGFSQQSLYLQHTAPPPPPPSAAPPDMFQTQLSQYRMQPPAYGTSQQLSNNPNTVLISSSTNSLMSASVKPSPQPIGAIGSKAGSYQAPSQPPPSQLYIYPDPGQLQLQSTFLQNSQLVQRSAPTMPPSSASYYSANNPITGGGAGGYFQPGSSNMQAAQSLHQSTFGMQAFNTQSPTPAGMGSFGSTMAQQYCSTAPSYLKSAADHQDVLSVFSSPATQINSPKSRCGPASGGKPGPASGAPQQQPSPTPNHKFTAYQQNVSPTTQLMIQQQQQQQQHQQQRGGVSVRVTPRYPAPIQRPVSYQPSPPPPRHLPPTSRARYKPTSASTPAAPATAATTAAAAHYYTTQSNTPKLENPEIEAKSEAVSNECEDNSHGAATDIPTEDSSSANE